jgi:hypothetical protein
MDRNTVNVWLCHANLAISGIHIGTVTCELRFQVKKIMADFVCCYFKWYHPYEVKFLDSLIPHWAVCSYVCFERIQRDQLIDIC